MSDGRIERVGSATDAVPEEALAIDLAGRTLMPGLIDAHVHLKAPELEVMHYGAFRGPRDEGGGCGCDLHAPETGETRSALTLEQILHMVATVAKIPGDARYREPILQAALDSLWLRKDA